MSDQKDPILDLISFDANEMPTTKKPHVETIFTKEGCPDVFIARRRYEENENRMTIEHLEQMVDKCKNDIVAMQTHLRKWEAILEWAKKQEGVALNEAEGQQFAYVKNQIEDLKALEKKKDKKPDDVLAMKKLKEAIDKGMAEMRPAIKAKLNYAKA